MHHWRSVSLFALATVSAIASAQVGTSTIVSTAGSVAGIDRTGAGGDWKGLEGTASLAGISYGPGDQIVRHEDKFTLAGGNLEGRSFEGFVSETPTGAIVTSGFSSVSDPGSSDAPTYYTATWTSVSQQNNLALAPTSSGTYDPWAVRYADVSALGTPDLGTADLYFQAGILASDSASTGFDVGSQQIGNYGLQVYITENDARKRLFGISVDTDGTLTLKYNLPSDFLLVLLGANANDPFASPTARLMATDAVPIGSLGALAQAVGGALNPDGSLSRDLNFGLLRQGFVLQPSPDPNKTLFSWHTDSFTGVRAVPEPSTMVVLSLALLGLRRRKASN